MASERSSSRAPPSSSSHGRLLTKSPRSRLQKRPVAAARSASAGGREALRAGRVAAQPGDGREGRLQDRGGEQVEGALLLARPREAVVDPHRGHAPVLDRQQAVLPAPREEVVGEADEARVELGQEVRLAGLLVVLPAVEDEASRRGRGAAPTASRPPAAARSGRGGRRPASSRGSSRPGSGPSLNVRRKRRAERRFAAARGASRGADGRRRRCTAGARVPCRPRSSPGPQLTSVLNEASKTRWSRARRR